MHPKWFIRSSVCYRSESSRSYAAEIDFSAGDTSGSQHKTWHPGKGIGIGPLLGGKVPGRISIRERHQWGEPSRRLEDATRLC